MALAQSEISRSFGSAAMHDGEVIDLAQSVEHRFHMRRGKECRKRGTVLADAKQLNRRGSIPRNHVFEGRMADQQLGEPRPLRNSENDLKDGRGRVGIDDENALALPGKGAGDAGNTGSGIGEHLADPGYSDALDAQCLACAHRPRTCELHRARITARRIGNRLIGVGNGGAGIGSGRQFAKRRRQFDGVLAPR